MNVRLHVLAWSAKRLFVMCCGAAVLSATMISTSAWAQDADEGEKAAKMAEAAVRAQEDAIKRMASQLEAHQKALIQQQKMMESQVEAQQKAFREQQKQFEAKQQEFQRLRANPFSTDGQKSQVPNGSGEYWKSLQQSQDAQAALAQLQAVNQKARAAPLPEKALTRVFALKYGKPGELSRVLADIVGERGMRTGVDERSNSLIVSADDKTMSIVDALVQKLDSSSGESASSDDTKTLQLRIVWLVDGVDGREPAQAIDLGGGQQSAGLVTPQVVDALTLLGFEAPKVVCQQVTTLTLGGNNRRGQFQFDVPVMINEYLWQLGGNGMVTPTSGDRFALQFELEFSRMDGRDVEKQRSSQLGGSIYAPLGHYTVLGTSTLIGPSGSDENEKSQHLSAFVVYLDRAPEFPSAAPAEKEPK